VSKRSFKIDRLQIRLQGVAPAVAQSATKDFGPHLLAQLASSSNGLNNRGAMTIGKIDSGRVVVSSGITPDGLRHVIARRIADSINVRLKSLV
jgi:hypothetical protein